MNNRHLFGLSNNNFEDLMIQNMLKFDVLDSIEDYDFKVSDGELKLFKGNNEIFAFSENNNKGEADTNRLECVNIKLGDAEITTHRDFDVTPISIDYTIYSPYDVIPTQLLNISNIKSYEPLSKVNIGYFPDSAYNEIDISTIPAEKFTHIILGFMWAQPSQTDYNNADSQGWSYSGFYDSSYTEGILTFRNKDDTYNIIKELKGLRQKYPHLKVGFSLGGASLSWNLSKVMGDVTLRDNLVKSIVSFLIRNDIDFVDIDYEYPRLQTHAWDYYDPINDIPNFILFLQELRSLLNNKSPDKYKQITIAIGNYQSLISQYNGVSPYVDLVFLMTYDFAGHTYNGTNPMTSLDSFISNNDRYAKKSVEFATTLANIPLNKICIATASYGIGWESVTPPATATDYFGTSNSGEAYNFSTGAKDGIEFYDNIVSKIASDSSYVVTYGNDANSMVYLAKDIGSGNFEIWSYENEVTAGYKADYIIETGLAGCINWELTKDTLSDESTSIFHALYTKFLNIENSSISLFTNSVERVRISNSGNVGINNINPSKTLDVLGDVNFSGSLFNNGVEYGVTSWDISGNDIYNNNSGNIGIGTNSPSTLLHLEGADSGTPPIFFISNTSEDWGGIRLGDSSAPTNQNFDILFNSSTQHLKIRSDDYDNIQFFEYDTGHIGFGTDSPDSPIHIENSSIRLMKMIRTSSGSPSTEGSYFEIQNPTGTRLLMGCGGSDFSGTDSSVAMLGTWTNSDLEFKTNGTRYMTIKADGKVGINTSSPTFQFQVNGDAKINGEFTCEKVITTGTINPADDIEDIITGPFAVRSVNSSTTSYLPYKEDFNESTTTTKTARETDGSYHNFLTENITRLYIDSSGNVGLGNFQNPSINLAIGDNDTGLNWISDGQLEFTSNGANNRVMAFDTNRNIVFGDRNIIGTSELSGLTEAIIMANANAYGDDKYFVALWEDASNTHQIGFEFDYYTGSGGTSTTHSRINLVSNAQDFEAINGSGKNYTTSFLSNGNCMFYGSNGGSVITPQLTITLGDGDTGIDWKSDGEFTIQNNNSETMRFNSDGKVGVNMSWNPSARFEVYSVNTEAFRISMDELTPGVARAMTFHNKSLDRFIIQGDGDCENRNNTYTSISDERIKKNIIPCNSQWEDIKNIEVVNFNFINEDELKHIGVVAQQVETISPGLVKNTDGSEEVNGELVENIKSVKYSILYMKSIKALQEAQLRIETLEIDNNVLKTQLNEMQLKIEKTDDNYENIKLDNSILKTQMTDILMRLQLLENK